MRVIDTHCHLAHGRLRQKLDDIFARAAEADVVGMICASGELTEARAALHIAQQHANVFMTVGMHPHDAKSFDDNAARQVDELARRDECVAVGEIGLDYHYDFSPRDDQRDAFARQLELAKAINKPIVIHCREALDDTLSLLAGADLGNQPVVFHSFTEGPDSVRRLLDVGALIGYSGIATFSRAADTRAGAALVPDDHILVETDAPYLSPEPVRRIKVNEPANVVHVSACLAGARGVSPEAFADQTTANAIRVFGLDLTDGPPYA